MLPNERFALACRAYYDEIGLIVDESNSEFAHSPLTRKECDTGYYLLHGHHQHQGLLQSKDLGKCCFFNYDALTWLQECDYWPENYFELWDIYEEYSGSNARKLHEERDTNGKSLHWIKSAMRALEEKDEFGKCLVATKGGKTAGKKIHEKKDENGKSVHGIECAKIMNKKLHKEKDELGRSKTAMNTNTQVWESTVDGFRSHAGGVARYNKARGWDPNARIRVK
jgi:hypothetical protein